MKFNFESEEKLLESSRSIFNKVAKDHNYKLRDYEVSYDQDNKIVKFKLTAVANKFDQMRCVLQLVGHCNPSGNWDLDAWKNETDIPSWIREEFKVLKFKYINFGFWAESMIPVMGGYDDKIVKPPVITNKYVVAFDDNGLDAFLESAEQQVKIFKATYGDNKEKDK